MPEIQWTTEAVEAKALEMIDMWEPHCRSDMETVLATHLAYLTASHLKLQLQLQLQLHCNCRRHIKSMSDQ